MNRLKAQYSFIDLLKPETAGVGAGSVRDLVTAAPRRPRPDPAERTPGPVRYQVGATVLQLAECQPGEQVPCYVLVLVDFVRDTEAEARDLARQIAIEGCWRQDQTGETVGEYFPAHRVQRVRVSTVVL